MVGLTSAAGLYNYLRINAPCGAPGSELEPGIAKRIGHQSERTPLSVAVQKSDVSASRSRARIQMAGALDNAARQPADRHLGIITVVADHHVEENFCSRGPVCGITLERVTVEPRGNLRSSRQQPYIIGDAEGRRIVAVINQIEPPGIGVVEGGI